MVVPPPVPEPTGALPPVRRTLIVRVVERRDPFLATAVIVSVWAPTASDDVASLPLSPFITKGVLRSVQRSLPSTRNSTRLIAGLAETFALTLMLPDTVAPALGDVNATVGRVAAAACALETGSEPPDPVVPMTARAAIAPTAIRPPIEARMRGGSMFS